MNDALLGYTGFVGSHIRENLSPDCTKYFNSKNILDAVDQEFDTVYCAPDVGVDVEVLYTIKCRVFILISTIDVHNREVLDQVEDHIVPCKESYRYELEVHLRQHFGDKLVIARLPALFGVGLKTNYVYDLMNNNQLDRININSAFQWYSLSWLWEDLQVARENGRKVVNLYPETVETADLVTTFFPQVDPRTLQYGPRFFYPQSSNFGCKSRHEVFVAMEEYLGIEVNKKNPNNLVISNMAWRPEHNEHAVFLMKRYGVNRLEILPTKFASWEEVFRNNLEEQLGVFRRHGISVYSVQSVFHGVQGKFGDDHVEKHLEKVVRFCENVGAEVLVMGSPSMRGNKCDRESLADLLEKVQATTKNVKICLEPNSTMYMCHVGTTLDSCREVRGKRGFWLNYDTGNAYMEKDRLPEIRDKIGHVQISNALLNPMKGMDYERLVRSGMCGAIAELLESSTVKVSLEISMFDNIKLFGEQVRRFSRFHRMYFMRF